MLLFEITTRTPLLTNVHPRGLLKQLRAASRKQLKHLLSQFAKRVCITDLALGNGFFLQIKLHWKSKERLEMTLLKLQMVATAVVALEFKVHSVR